MTIAPRDAFSSLSPIGLAGLPKRPTLGIGPERPDFGSWNWVGADTAKVLSDEFDVRIIGEDIPASDIIVFIKARPDFSTLRSI